MRSLLLAAADVALAGHTDVPPQQVTPYPRVERCGAALCLRANKVSITLSPDAAETEVR